jgi:hypothetical protein
VLIFFSFSLRTLLSALLQRSKFVGQPEKAKFFIRKARAEDGRKALSEHEVQAGAVRKKTARLKALRLAKEAAAKANPGK